MFAVIAIAGSQQIVKVGDKIVVNRLDVAEGSKTILDKVLLVFDEKGEKTEIGCPYLSKSVEAKVLRHFRGEKIKVYKKKKKKRYARTQGHRQELSELEILSIGEAKEIKAKEISTPKTVKKVETEKVVKKEKKTEEAEKTPKKKTTKKKDQMSLL